MAEESTASASVPGGTALCGSDPGRSSIGNAGVGTNFVVSVAVVILAAVQLFRSLCDRLGYRWTRSILSLTFTEALGQDKYFCLCLFDQTTRSGPGQLSGNPCPGKPVRRYSFIPVSLPIKQSVPGDTMKID